MGIVQKYCEHCGLDYHGVAAFQCKAESPNVGTPAWRNGRSQVMANIHHRQKDLRAHIVKWEGEPKLREMQRRSTEKLNEATYGLEKEDGPNW